MARNVVKRDQGATAKPVEETVDKAAMQGGTSGEPPDPNPVKMSMGLADVAPAREVIPTLEAVEPKRFEVIGGPDMVMYEGQRVRMLRGKIYTDTVVDLELLRRQGVEFRELDAQA